MIVVISTILLVGAYGNPSEYFTDDPLFIDTNIESVDINEKLTLNGKEYDIQALEVGDNYSVLYFDAGKEGGMITGAELYQDGNALKYISACSTTYDGSAIAYAPAVGTKNIELRINSVNEIIEKEYNYDVVFNGDTAVIDVSIGEDRGSITMKLSDTLSIEWKDLPNVMKTSVSGYPVQPAKIIPSINGKEVESEFSINNPPNMITIVTKEFIFDENVIIINIS